MTKQKIAIVGLTGKLDSAAAAYLLKKQGFQVIGIGIHYCSAESPERVLADSHFVESLDELKQLADTLDITFYAVNAEAQFRASVVDPFVEARLFGLHFCLETALTKMLFEVLEEKRQLLKADLLATGHYAKLGRSHLAQENGLLLANDLQSDQSFALSQVPRALFEHAIFPLSDLRKVEVAKIGKLVTGKVKPSAPLLNELSFNQDSLGALVVKNASHKLSKEGPIIKYSEESVVGEHKGVYAYYCGQKKLQSLDRELEVVCLDAPRGVVYVDYPRFVPQTHLVLHYLLLEQGFDQTKGREVWIQYGPYGVRLKARIQFFNNGFALLELTKPQQAKIYPGYHLTLSTKEGAGAKVFGSARVFKSGVLEEREFLSLPRIKEDEENKVQEKKWDYLF